MINKIIIDGIDIIKKAKEIGNEPTKDKTTHYNDFDSFQCRY